MGVVERDETTSSTEDSLDMSAWKKVVLRGGERDGGKGVVSMA